MNRRGFIARALSATIAPVALSLACKAQALQVSGTTAVVFEEPTLDALGAGSIGHYEAFVDQTMRDMAKALRVDAKLLGGAPMPYSSAREANLAYMEAQERARQRNLKRPTMDNFLRRFNTERGAYER